VLSTVYIHYVNYAVIIFAVLALAVIYYVCYRVLLCALAIHFQRGEVYLSAKRIARPSQKAVYDSVFHCFTLSKIYVFV